MSSGCTTSTAAFAVGEVVDVRANGRAEVIEALVTDSGHKFHGRIRVKYLIDGKTYYARPETLRRLAKVGVKRSPWRALIGGDAGAKSYLMPLHVQPPSRVVICETTKQYLAAAIAYTNHTDACLEIGCHEGVHHARHVRVHAASMQRPCSVHAAHGCHITAATCMQRLCRMQHRIHHCITCMWTTCWRRTSKGSFGTANAVSWQMMCEASCSTRIRHGLCAAGRLRMGPRMQAKRHTSCPSAAITWLG